MAASDEVTPIIEKILNGTVDQNRSNSAAINKKLAGNINALIDDRPPIVFTANGRVRDYFSYSTCIDGVVRIDRDVSITSWKFSVDEVVAASVDESLNVGVYDVDDNFIGNLFTTAPALRESTGTGTGAVVGQAEDLSIINEGTVGFVTSETGVLNISQLLQGQKLRCFVVSASGKSKNFRLEIKAA